MKDPYWPCDNPCINGYYDKKNKINVICINTADTSHCKPGKTTSSLNWSEGFASVGTRYQPSQNHSINYSSFDKQFLERTPTTYTRPEFIPYTQPSQPFVEPDRPYAPPQNTDPVIVNKETIDKSIDFRKSKDYENALKSCDKIISYMGNIDNYGIGKVEGFNKLYLERKKQHVEAVAKRDYLYSQGVINGVNGFDWYKANPTRDFYSFFRDTLKVSDKSPENVKLIKDRLYKNLPPYLEQAKKSNYFLDEYNKYYKDMMALKEKLSQLIDICNIKAIASKKLGDYEKALESCDIAIKINPKDLTASNFKSFILKEKTDFEKAIEYSDGTFRIKRLCLIDCVNSHKL
ncbi:MAG TPA: tetratricopeptide repeat protein [Candidatus Megaira endosymbiont of Stentor roeselii]|nr:tetratricopeptide repeat protein [Candidatus Megaera endosymbiont of Stentor roeselii]